MSYTETSAAITLAFALISIHLGDYGYVLGSGIATLGFFLYELLGDNQ